MEHFAEMKSSIWFSGERLGRKASYSELVYKKFRKFTVGSAIPFPVEVCILVKRAVSHSVKSRKLTDPKRWEFAILS
jgi:hypothetical protein